MKSPRQAAELTEIEPLSQYVCERIRQLRKRHSWTLQQLASTSGVSRSMLSQVERGSANPTLS
ncbi:MAG: helix-turn-helix transcriptional regulator, partial [Mariniblastus sp.]|nr:helix-turn-helix transcriptional regulator [Mariniblastus sp.]